MHAPKIMIVEDEFLIATNLKLTLEDLGYVPLEPAMNLSQALELLENEEPDMAILDINLSGKHEGIEIGRILFETKKIPFIYLTSNADKATINEAKHTHPNAYLIKPFTPEDIYAAIETALAPIAQSDNPEEEKLTLLADSFFIKLGSKYIKVDVRDITYFEAEGKLINIYTSQQQKFNIRSSMEGLLGQLAQYNFIRVHRSFCINANHLQVINSEYVTVSDKQIPIGRNYRDNLLGRIKTLN